MAENKVERNFFYGGKYPKNKGYFDSVVVLLVFRKIYIIFSCVFLKKGVLIYFKLIHLSLKNRNGAKDQRFYKLIKPALKAGCSKQTSLPKARVFTETVSAHQFF